MLAVVSENTRASDNDRNDICGVLDAALEDGQLSTEEHRERVSAATRAVTLGELQSLVSDLQIRKTPIQRPMLKISAIGWAIWIPVAAVLVLLAGGIVWGLLRNHPARSNPAASKTSSTASSTPSSTADNPVVITTTTTSPQPAPELLTLSGVTRVLAQMRTQFGDTLGYQLNIYPDKAVLQRPDTANAHKIVEWIFRKGSWTNQGASTDVFSDSGSATSASSMCKRCLAS